MIQKLLSLGLIVAFALSAQAAGKKVVVKRIRFARGSNTAIVRGTVRRGDYLDYRLEAKAGQLMIVHLVARLGKGKFQVGAVNGPGPYYGANMVSDWQGTLPVGGQHLIILYADEERLDFNLEVVIL